MNELERDELLVRLDERTARTERLLLGNGQPGLVQRVSVIEGRIEEAHKAGAKAGASAGGRRSALITAAILALGVVAKILGIPVPV